MKNYPFTSCLHPQKVYNIYTKQYLSVPCGHCKSCMLHKSSRYTLLSTLESIVHRHTYFVTLTYSNEYLPKCKLVQTDANKYTLYDYDTGELLKEGVYISDNELNALYCKIGNEYIPYLNKYELQLFIKRLRDYYERQGIKLRYHAVGEYGPKHFRPHYHLLLWLEGQGTYYPTLPDNIRKAWQYGRTDCQISEGNTSRYVSGYANSFSFVPSILKTTEFRPFCTHSQKLGQAYCRKDCEKVYEIPFEEFITRSYNNNGKYKEFNVWRSYIDAYFPRCFGYSDKSSYQRLDSYRLYRKISQYIDKEFTLTHYADLLVKLILNNPYNLPHCVDTHVFNYFLALFRKYYPLYKKRSSNINELEKSFFTRVYSELRISRQFCNIADMCSFEGMYGIYTQQFITKDDVLLYYIENFYNKYDLYILNRHLKSQENFFNQFVKSNMICDIDEIRNDILSIYNPDYEKNNIYYTLAYKRFQKETLERFNDSIKHKRQNDINKLLFNQNDY